MVGYGLKVFLDVVSLQTYLLTHGQNKCPNDSYSEKNSLGPSIQVPETAQSNGVI